MPKGNRKPIAIVMLVLVGIVLYGLMQSASSVSLDTAFVKKTTEFGEEFIQTYDIPAVLSDEQEEALGTVIPVFFQDDLPIEFQQEAERQREIQGERDLLQEQIDSPNNTRSDINIPVTQETEGTGVTHLSASKLQIDRSAGDISKGLQFVDVSDNTFIRGDMVRLAGKISLEKPAPYFYNVIITCCQMTSFKAMTAVSTDAQGNFILKIPTDRHYPLGNWQVEITTIGDSSKILLHTYHFTLLSDV